jgi:GntR family transcriptional regulator
MNATVGRSRWSALTKDTPQSIRPRWNKADPLRNSFYFTDFWTFAGEATAAGCTIRYNTAVIPFRLIFRPGVSLYEQVVYTAKRAVVSGRLRAGEPFPSVRALSRELKINPNTAHKVIAQLITEGLLEVRVGVGTVVAGPRASTAAERSQLLKGELEELVVEAKKLGMDLEDVLDAVAHHWKRLGTSVEQSVEIGRGGRDRQ